QVHKNPGAAEKDDRAQDQTVIEKRVEYAVLVEVAPLAGRLKHGQQEQREQRQQREQVEQDRTAAEKVLLDLETKDRADLAQPQPPRQRRSLARNCFYCRTHSF